MSWEWIKQYKGRITALVSVVGPILLGLIWVANNWDRGVAFVNRVDFIYDNAESVEHVIEDYNELLNSISFASEQTALFYRENNRLEQKVDSLMNIIDIMAYGKVPYQDTIWYMNEYGQWIKCNIKEHPILNR